MTSLTVFRRRYVPRNGRNVRRNLKVLLASFEIDLSEQTAKHLNCRHDENITFAGRHIGPGFDRLSLRLWVAVA